MRQAENLQVIKNWPEDERPRERLIKFGAETLSHAQLLAIILRTGDRVAGKNALDMARDLLKQFGGFRELESAGINEIVHVKGIGIAKAAQIKAALEMGKRMLSIDRIKNNRFITSRDVADYYQSAMKGLKKEMFKTVLLDSKNCFIKDFIVSEGSLTESIVHPREVFNSAVKESAAAVILVHNHPSGDPAPSKEDRSITTRLMKAGKILGINVLDHIIIGRSGYFSFSDEKLMGI